MQPRAPSEQSLQDSKNCTQKYIENEYSHQYVCQGLYNETATRRLGGRRSLPLLKKMKLRKHIALLAEKAPDPVCLRVLWPFG